MLKFVYIVYEHNPDIIAGMYSTLSNAQLSMIECLIEQCKQDVEREFFETKDINPFDETSIYKVPLDEYYGIGEITDCDSVENPIIIVGNADFYQNLLNQRDKLKS
uniref:Uncharacterized protein n=1 Tax=viral metagenome TaxID=1070528 RepID=A0A6C0J885_9ZZZZ